jgi:hypothetical protein
MMISWRDQRAHFNNSEKEEWKHKRHKNKNKTPDWKLGEGAMLGKQIMNETMDCFLLD